MSSTTVGQLTRFLFTHDVLAVQNQTQKWSLSSKSRRDKTETEESYFLSLILERESCKNEKRAVLETVVDRDKVSRDAWLIEYRTTQENTSTPH